MWYESRDFIIVIAPIILFYYIIYKSCDLTILPRSGGVKGFNKWILDNICQHPYQKISVVIEWQPLLLETIVNLDDSTFAQNAEDIIEEDDNDLELDDEENDSLQVALDNISDDEGGNLDYNAEEIANEALLDL